MFHHIKDLQFDARVSEPDPRFARLLLEQFGGANGELTAAMTYFVQAFSCRKPYPKHYDLLMDIAMEAFSHLEIVGATITMLLNGINGALEDAAERSTLMKLLNGKRETEQMAHEATSPHFLVLFRRRTYRHRLPGSAVVGGFRQRQWRPHGGSSLRYRRREPGQNRLRVPHAVHGRPAREGEPGVPDDSRNRAHANVHRGAQRCAAELSSRHSAGRPACDPHLFQSLERRRCAPPVEPGPAAMASRRRVGLHS
jgi:hypothetical protein